MSTVAFKTVGCRLNQAETATLSASLEKTGITIVPWGGKADAFIIHTCAVTGKAEKDCMRLSRSIKRDYPESMVILAGCAVEVDREQLKAKSGADILLDQKTKFKLPEILAELGLSSNEAVSSDAANHYSERTRASIKVQDGCDFRCSYCIVPMARGKPTSRNHKDILSEVRAVTRSGVKEIVLTGVNIGTYSDNGIKLAGLIRMLEDIDALSRIRISSIEPTTAEDEIIEMMAGKSKLCHFFHLPIQSGDNAVLRMMRRRHNTDRIRSFVSNAAKLVPGIGLGTDIIVGFPGETDEMFSNSLEFLKSMPFSNIHAFSYSSRPGTEAASMPGHNTTEEIKERMKSISQVKADKRNSFAGSFIGKNVSVLVETVDGKGIGKGWTSEYVEARVKDVTENTIVEFIPSSVANGCVRN